MVAGISAKELNQPDPLDVALEQEGATAEFTAKKFKKLADAKMIKPFLPKGETVVVYSKVLEDNTTQLKATIEIAKVRNWYPKTTVELHHSLTEETERWMAEIDGRTRGKLPAKLADEEEG